MWDAWVAGGLVAVGTSVAAFVPAHPARTAESALEALPTSATEEAVPVTAGPSHPSAASLPRHLRELGAPLSSGLEQRSAFPRAAARFEQVTSARMTGFADFGEVFTFGVALREWPLIVVASTG